MLVHEEITEAIIAAAIEVHRELGPGLLESTYEQCLCREISLRGLAVNCQVAVPVVYKGEKIDCGYRIDILVENAVIIEVKSIDKLHPIHEAQLMTYLKLSNKRVGLLINFNVLKLMDGLKRRVL